MVVVGFGGEGGDLVWWGRVGVGVGVMVGFGGVGGVWEEVG